MPSLGLPPGGGARRHPRQLLPPRWPLPARHPAPLPRPGRARGAALPPGVVHGAHGGRDGAAPRRRAPRLGAAAPDASPGPRTARRRPPRVLHPGALLALLQARPPVQRLQHPLRVPAARPGGSTRLPGSLPGAHRPARVAARHLLRGGGPPGAADRPLGRLPAAGSGSARTGEPRDGGQASHGGGRGAPVRSRRAGRSCTARCCGWRTKSTCCSSACITSRRTAGPWVSCPAS